MPNAKVPPKADLLDAAVRRKLIPPNDGYGYFELDNPFEPAPQGFSEANAWWMAEASLLAYCRAEVVRRQVAKLKARGWEVWPREGLLEVSASTQLFAMYNREVCIVALRGTELRDPARAAADVLVDAQAWLHHPHVWSPVGIHSGFFEQSQAAMRMLPLLFDGPARDLKLWFTGHSLGGALALLCAWASRRATGVYTYGMPAVGNRSFNATSGLGGKLWRVIHGDDLLPRVPPQAPLFGYAQMGEPRWLTRDGRWAPGEPSLSLQAAELLARVVQLEVPQLEGPTPLTDHAPIYYASHLFNRLNRP